MGGADEPLPLARSPGRRGARPTPSAGGGGGGRGAWGSKQRLKSLGSAFAQYTGDKEGVLPPAVLDNGEMESSWDREIAPYLSGDSAKGAGTKQWSAIKDEV